MPRRAYLEANCLRYSTPPVNIYLQLISQQPGPFYSDIFIIIIIMEIAMSWDTHLSS